MLEQLQNLDIKSKPANNTTGLSLPGFAGPASKSALDFSNLKIRYLKIDMDDLSSVADLERIETKAIRNEGVYILGKKEFIFMDKIFILVNYMEESE